jgi:hypothetical protein
MKVELNSRDQLRDLVERLTAARCLVRPVGETSCLVQPLDACDPAEALLELRFFVASWASRHPGVVATVSA